MTVTKEDVRCPNCKKKNRIKIRSEVSSEEIDKIVDRSLFKVKCLSCGETIVVEYPLKVTGDNYIVYYTPCKTKTIEDEHREYMRICDTFDDFKEKLLIMNDSLNDIVIEFIKDYVLTQIDDDIKKEVRDIRYDGSDEEKIIFYLIGANQSIGCSKEIYSNILKKSKIKKIDKCVNIDHQTYQKYFKLR